MIELHLPHRPAAPRRGNACQPLRRWTAVLCLLALASCQQTVTKSDAPFGSPAPQQQTPARGLSPMDPSPMRLQDIGGAMLIYFFSHKQLPADVMELAAVPDLGIDLDFTSPIDGRPYVYIPGGLVDSTASTRIVMYDQAILPNGGHWCLVVTHLKTGSALSTDVKALSAAQFKMYQPVTPPANVTSPAR